MLTLKNIAAPDFKINNEPAGKNTNSRSGCFPLFFLVHYGIFHLVYLFFLTTIVDIKKIDVTFIEFSSFLILVTCIANFIQNKIRNRTEDVNIGAMFFMPYARVIPMHIIILLPLFFNIRTGAIFLVLKMLADVIMYLVYTNAVFKPVKKVT